MSTGKRKHSRRRATKRPPAAVVPAVQHVPFTTAEELLDALSPRHPYWKEDQSAWVFRGHADITWPLLPAALRPDVLLGYEPGMKEGTFPTNGEQVRAEFKVLWDFLKRADAQGLPVPGDSQLFRLPEGWRQHLAPFLDENLKSGTHQWPPSELLSQAALAQHYGVPTRLLDWARNGAVAAYFAARGAASAWANGNPKKLTHIAIWALNWQYVCNRWPGGTVPQMRNIRGNRSPVGTWLGREQPE
jgi:hypothetical protein